MKTILRMTAVLALIGFLGTAKPAQAQVSVGIATPGFALGVGPGAGYVGVGGYYPGYPVVGAPIYAPRPVIVAPPIYGRPYYGGGYYGGYYGRPGYGPRPGYYGPGRGYYRR